MKKLLFSIVLMAAATCSSVYAQNRAQLTPEEKAERRVESLNRTLNLTADQQKEIKSLYTDFFNNTCAANGEEKPVKAGCAANDELNKKVEALLTEDQAKLFREQCQRKPGPKGRQHKMRQTQP